LTGAERVIEGWQVRASSAEDVGLRGRTALPEAEDDRVKEDVSRRQLGRILEDPGVRSRAAAVVDFARDNRASAHGPDEMREMSAAAGKD
jgi:hypothetical protein